MAYYVTDDCIACGACLDECEHDAITEGEEKYSIAADKCEDCGDCVEVCPSDAILPVEE